jgi:hypothetical protein
MINHFSKKGFSFNMLSTYVDYKENHLFYGDPLFFLITVKKIILSMFLYYMITLYGNLL